jgi:hypothetical protein
MALSNRWKTRSDFAIGVISSPRSKQDIKRKRRPSNDRVARNKTEKKTVLSTPWEQDSGSLHSKRSKALPNQRSVPSGSNSQSHNDQALRRTCRRARFEQKSGQQDGY